MAKLALTPTSTILAKDRILTGNFAQDAPLGKHQGRAVASSQVVNRGWGKPMAYNNIEEKIDEKEAGCPASSINSENKELFLVLKFFLTCVHDLLSQVLRNQVVVIELH